MQVSFYLPEKYLPDASRQEAWKSGTITTLEQGGKIASAQAWIYQTWLELNNAGCQAALSHTFPEQGIVLTLSGFLDRGFRPAPGVFFADIVADATPHPGAHWHLVQNSLHASRLPRSAFIPHWPHPNLLPRNPHRGSLFETLGFFGDALNLAPELRDPRWQADLRKSTGLDLKILAAESWHDYRTVDCVLAVRGFGRRRYLRKPGTKLYNAWLASVPFIGGRDSAYHRDGEEGRDHLTARSRTQLQKQLLRLKDDVRLREALVETGRKKSAQFNRPAILQRWRELVETTLPEAARAWHKKSPAAKKRLALRQALMAWVDWHLVA